MCVLVYTVCKDVAAEVWACIYDTVLSDGIWMCSLGGALLTLWSIKRCTEAFSRLHKRHASEKSANVTNVNLYTTRLKTSVSLTDLDKHAQRNKVTTQHLSHLTAAVTTLAFSDNTTPTHTCSHTSNLFTVAQPWTAKWCLQSKFSKIWHTRCKTYFCKWWRLEPPEISWVSFKHYQDRMHYRFVALIIGTDTKQPCNNLIYDIKLINE